MLQDIVMGILFIILSSVIYIETYSTRAGSFEYLGPSFFPRLLCIILAILSLILIVQAAFKIKSKYGLSELFNKAEKFFLGYWKVILELIFTGLFVVLLPYLGYIISSAIYLIISSLLIKPEFKSNTIIHFTILIVFTIAIYYIFAGVLNVYLPSGKLL